MAVMVSLWCHLVVLRSSVVHSVPHQALAAPGPEGHSEHLHSEGLRIGCCRRMSQTHRHIVKKKEGLGNPFQLMPWQPLKGTRRKERKESHECPIQTSRMGVFEVHKKHRTCAQNGTLANFLLHWRNTRYIQLLSWGRRQFSQWGWDLQQPPVPGQRSAPKLILQAPLPPATARRCAVSGSGLWAEHGGTKNSGNCQDMPRYVKNGRMILKAILKLPMSIRPAECPPNGLLAGFSLMKWLQKKYSALWNFEIKSTKSTCGESACFPWSKFAAQKYLKQRD